MHAAKPGVMAEVPRPNQKGLVLVPTFGASPLTSERFQQNRSHVALNIKVVNVIVWKHLHKNTQSSVFSRKKHLAKNISILWSFRDNSAFSSSSNRSSAFGPLSLSYSISSKAIKRVQAKNSSLTIRISAWKKPKAPKVPRVFVTGYCTVKGGLAFLNDKL